MLPPDPPEAADSQDEPTTVPATIGPYRLKGELGGGGMGEVYRALDERLERAVAVKHVRAGSAVEGFDRERFRREARATASLSHPAIVQIFDVIEDDDGGWLVMELVEGQALARLVMTGPLELAAALPLFVDVAEALAEAHHKGILHRDLKAENVMVTPVGRAKLLDFGLAHWIDVDEVEDSVTVEGKIIGTPYAMSPEQAMSLDLDHRSDLFSLGTLFYETLTGTRPFRGDLVGTLHQVCLTQQRPVQELNPRVPGELSRLIDRLLEKEPEKRPEDAGKVARTLRRMAGRQFLALDSPEPGAAGAAEASRRRRAATTPSGERRQITLVHCELVSSGSESGSLDLEELLEVRPVLKRIATRAAARFDGEIGELLDQGLRLFFGFPQAHEDDATRAAYAAREIVVGLEGLAEDLGVRVGVHTGPVVIAGEQLALGETASVAAALQGLAPPGEVLISAATFRIVGLAFRTEPMPPARVPGFSRPLEIHRLIDVEKRR